MAIHPAYPGLEVEILVDGAALPEYVDSEVVDDEETVTRYVEASSGAAFAVRCSLPKTLFTAHSVLLAIDIDGVVVRSTTYEQSIFGQSGHTEIFFTSSAIIDGVSMGQQFHFTEIKPSKYFPF